VIEHALDLGTRARGRSRLLARAALARLERVRPSYVVGTLVLAEWLLTLALALTVRHNGWLYYQGGDQLWYYTTSWLMAHGHLPPTAVGYGWSVLLLPVSLVGGPNLLDAIPAIVLVNVLFLMPVAMAAMYGIGERLGGRLFGYWVLLVWLVVPFAGIRYTNAGYHQKYTEISLPQTFGLTALSDFPSMVMLAVAAYFLVRALQRFTWFDAVAAGLFAGFAIGTKPSNALFLFAATASLVVARAWRTAIAFALALAPTGVALAFWKWRGLGYLPLLHAEQTVRLALGAGAAPLGAVNVSKYLYFDWSHLSTNLSSIREHFWSLRLLEWLPIAGMTALARRRLRWAILFGVWFLAYVIVKGSDPLGNIEDASLLRMLIPAIPAFVLLLAALPFLVPGVTRRLPLTSAPSALEASRGARVALAGVALLTVAVPVALTVAASPTAADAGAYLTRSAGPIPVDSHLGLRARTTHAAVELAWQPAGSSSARTFYVVVRGSGCGEAQSIADCSTIEEVAATTARSLRDHPPSRGTYLYELELSANWLDDKNLGDPYVASPPVAVTVP
jgi:hypothetical protein